jgi:hypothetical protein
MSFSLHPWEMIRMTVRKSTSVVTWRQGMVAMCEGWELLGLLDVFIVLGVVIVSQVYT